MSNDFVRRALNGDQFATQFLSDVLLVLHFWDGLAQGKAISTEQAMWAAVIDLPKNPFYRQHFDLLQPLVQASVLLLLTALELEAQPDAAGKDLSVAFIARQQWGALFLTCAAVVVGPHAAVKLGPQILLFVHGEGFTAYSTQLQARRNPVQP